MPQTFSCRSAGAHCRRMAVPDKPVSGAGWQAGRTPAILFSLPGNDSRLLTVDAVEMTREVRPRSSCAMAAVRIGCCLAAATGVPYRRSCDRGCCGAARAPRAHWLAVPATGAGRRGWQHREELAAIPGLGAITMLAQRPHVLLLTSNDVLNPVAPISSCVLKIVFGDRSRGSSTSTRCQTS